MTTALYPQFTQLYANFRLTGDYEDRKKQFAVVKVNKEIIEETLKNKPFTNLHLTGLIQMFQFGCSDEAFKKYLKLNIPDRKRRDAIYDENLAIAQWGYTGAGLNSIFQPDA